MRRHWRACRRDSEDRPWHLRSYNRRICASEPASEVGHPALRNGTRSVPQELFGTPVLHELIEVMRATLAGNGVGLAAPQIAVPLRLFVIEDTQNGCEVGTGNKGNIRQVLRARETVEPRTLTPLILVRIQVPQPGSRGSVPDT